MIYHSLPTSPPPPSSWVIQGLRHFLERLYSKDLSTIEILVGIGTIPGGDFCRWYLKTPCIKIVNTNLKEKKQSFRLYFHNFSLLVPYRNKFVVVCICIVVFHGTYSPLPTIFFFFKFLGDLLYWGILIPLLREGGQAIFFQKAIND